jgi:hypothetical protein
MNALATDFAGATVRLRQRMKGPVTAARQRRTALIYAAVCIVGLLPTLLGLSPSLRAAGIGLWMPGAGFIAVGGWAARLFTLTLLLFVFSLVAWFWAGMVLAPIAVWVGAAVAAGLVAGESVWAGAPFVAAAGVIAVGVGFSRRSSRLRDEAVAKAITRQAFVAQSLAEVVVNAAALPDPATREMSPEDLSALRYILDRALQPLDQWGGFDIIDQFQPAALRYQLNHMGFALGIAQSAYAPNFRGYLGQAQRNLIDKYLQRKVWGYWVYESCWGNFNFTNWDPADRDNIMLTGWFGMQVGQYMLNSGDRRYIEPGSLTFRLNDKTAYPHSYDTLIGSVASNYDTAEFGLFACEPNWIYPICNHYGMTALATQDAVRGTDNVRHYLPGWFAKLDAEFTDAGGSIIGLRSQHTGLPVPFPVGEAGYATFENCFAPDRARGLWAIARREIAPAVHPDANGKPRITLPGKGIDTGNYKSGHTLAYAAILLGAREFGDDALAEAAQNSLDSDCGREVVDGVRRYTGGSNLSNAYAVKGQLMRAGDFRRSFVEGPSVQSLAGPVVSEAAYPEVLVAKAISDGAGLHAVFYPGKTNGEQTIGFAQLTPNARYSVKGAVNTEILASADGKAMISVPLSGRSELSISPT